MMKEFIAISHKCVLFVMSAMVNGVETLHMDCAVLTSIPYRNVTTWSSLILIQIQTWTCVKRTKWIFSLSLKQNAVDTSKVSQT